MDALILDWLNIGLRWTHLIAGIGWIGTSLYFMWLDAALIRSDPPRSKVEGHAWLLHSGGFYLVEKRKVPDELSRKLHWFRWEAAMTWLSGMALLIVVYYLGGGALIDRDVADISLGAAVGGGVGALILGWLIYDLLMISPLG